jgi:hypothetical protein
MEKIETYTQFIEETEIVEPDLKGNSFIGGKAVEVSLSHLKEDCIIPVFSKDNESTISHYEFINEIQKAVRIASPSISITRPIIKVSHPVKGRIPSAIGKPVKELKEEEKTIYYERCAFIFQILDKKENVNGDDLNLTIGGVRAYNQENLYSTKSLEKFKLFIGYQNMVCTNLCISTDGFSDEVKVSSIGDLADHVMRLIQNYDMKRHLGMMERMSKFKLNEDEFAHFIGKLRIYNHLDKAKKSALPRILFTDNHINHVARSYLTDPNFGCDSEGNINLWQLYNLLTDANKVSYIDNNIERNVNAYELMNKLGDSILYEEPNWFLHIII